MKIQRNLNEQNTGNEAQINGLWKKALLKETAEQNLVIVVREPAVSHQKGQLFHELQRTRLYANTTVSCRVKHLTEGS